MLKVLGWGNVGEHPTDGEHSTSNKERHVFRLGTSLQAQLASRPHPNRCAASSGRGEGVPGYRAAKFPFAKCERVGLFNQPSQASGNLILLSA